MITNAKVSDYIADCLFNNGCEVIFGVSGGASLHLLDSVQRHPGLKLITVHHEQTVAMAAEAFSRISRKLGVGIVTSGPGATNLVTGVAGAFYDSVPCLFISGQVSTFRKSTGLGVRQYGFQETPIVEIIKPISKLALSVDSAQEVPKALADLIGAALHGRQGPVLLDIPDDLQRQYINVLEWSEQNGQIQELTAVPDKSLDISRAIQSLEIYLSESKKPVIVCGSGLMNSQYAETFLKILDRLCVPVALTWGAKSLIPWDREYLLGTFGTHGDRMANHMIQNSDLVVSFGSRLDTKSTGSPPSLFAPAARKLMFDVDKNESKKFVEKGLKIDEYFQVDFNNPEFGSFLGKMAELNLDWGRHKGWMEYWISTKTFSEEHNVNPNFVEPYTFIRELSQRVPNPCRIILDTGCTVAWSMQSWLVSSGHMLFHDFNNTAMGWSIPATLASTLVPDSIPTICLVGDGSLMMTIGDLASISLQRKPTLIFLMNNSGYSMIKQTQEQWFESRYFASDDRTGLAFPSFALLAQSFGFAYRKIQNTKEVSKVIQDESLFTTHTFVEVMIDPEARVVPQNRFGYAIDVMEPELPRNHIVK